MAITQVQSTNTFNEFRTTTNQVITELNKYENGTAVPLVNTVTANTIFANTHSTFGNNNLVLSTNNGANSGTIVINEGLNANVVITANGSGRILVNADTLRIGDQNVNASLTTWGTGDLILSTNETLNTGTIRIYDGVNGNVEITPNGTGSTSVKNLTTANAIVSTVATGTAPFTVDSTTVVTNLNADSVDGKGVGTLSAAGGIVYASSTSQMAGTAAGISGQAVISGGSGVPTFQNVAAANGASSIVSRNADGGFFAGVIGATFVGDGAGVSALNASNVSSGTLANARTTSNSANSGSTIVARDVHGSFAANIITGVSFVGNGSTLNNLNASNVSSGTLANVRTTADTANGASTIVLRDANGAFSAGAITSTSISGSGAQLTNLNASNVSSGTIDNARTTGSTANGASTLVLRDVHGSFNANGALIANLNGSNVTSGTIANARTTGSSSNGASTLVLRDVHGSFGANAAFFSDINASNVTSGTIANARTTAASANGASTIVSRDVNGDFAARTVTASLSGNATTSTTLQTARNINGVSFNGSADITITASTTQTLTRGTYLTGANFNGGTATTWAVDATDASTASKVVARDANASFSANVVSATTFSGSGASLTNLNGSNVSTGTIANARTTAATANGASTIVSRDANGDFAARNITATGFYGAVVGDGTAISNLNGSNVSTGTIANARTTASSVSGASTIVARDANGSFAANVVTATTFSGSLDWSNVANKPDPVVTVTLTGDVTGTASATLTDLASGTVTVATTVAADSVVLGTDTTGNYVAGLTAGNYTLVTGTAGEGWSPTVAVDATPNATASKVVARDTNGSFSANVVTATTFSGSGASLTTLNASNISSGTLDNARTTAASANGASTIIARDVNGSFSANVGTFNTISVAVGLGGDGSLITNLNASNVTTGTIANARTTAATANGASTIVLRDVNGDFAARNITATTFIGSVVGSGAGISSINASNVTTGTIANARTTGASANGANTLVLRDADGNFAGGIITAATFSGSGASLSSLNGSNITTGTIANARTTAASANGASTIVARDVNGNFSANIGTFNSISVAVGLGGDGSLITNLNASNVTTGTLANARTTAASANGASTIVARDGNGDFAARTITATSFSGSLDWSNVANKPDPVVTMTLTGDVTGTASATLTDLASGTITVATTVAADSVALGTDTTGNYVASVGAGTSSTQTGSSGLTISGTGESAAVTIAHADTSSLTGQQGTNGIANFTIDGLGHITAVTTATYLTAEADTLATVTGRGATTSSAISITNATASTSTTTGALTVTGGVGIGGALNATSKSFIIKHPTKPGMLLKHGSLEGPEFGVYVRGRATSAEIHLPDYWVGLVDEETITVNLTPHKSHQNLYVEKIENNVVYIKNVALGDIDCFYTVFGERKDIDRLAVETKDGE